MRHRALIYSLSALVLWSFVSYYIVFRRSSNTYKTNEQSLSELNTQLVDLHNQLSAQRTQNVELLQTLQKLIQQREDARAQSAPPAAGSDGRPAAAAAAAARPPVIGVLVLACDRVTVARHLDQLLRYRPSAAQFPIVVSQDCAHRPTSDVIARYAPHVTHIQQPDLSDIPLPPKEKKFKGYFKISRHYRWALGQMFDTFNHSTVVVLEDDLDVAPDVFEYFASTHPILRQDKTLWCVSAWNDNGKPDRVDTLAPEQLHRSDFFPGLGWMITSDLWQELRHKWPRSYWDDWMREPAQRRQRACIRPEVSRTRTFGKKGVSNGLFYEKYLKFIYLNTDPVIFSELDLTYLLKENYDAAFTARVYACPEVSYDDLRAGQLAHDGCVRLQYVTKDGFKRTAKMLGLMDDFKSGVPRTGYRGVVSFQYQSRRVYLAPRPGWSGYDLSWS